VAGIVPAQMTELIKTMSAIKDRAVTVGIDLPPALDRSDAKSFLDQFMKVIGDKGALVNEVAVSGRLPGDVRSVLRSRGVMIRPVQKTKPFLPKNDQAAVPMVMNSEVAAETLNAVFYSVAGDAGAISDPFAKDYMNLLKIAAAVHLADLTAGRPELRAKPELLKAELLKRLNLFEQTGGKGMVQMNARGLTISSIAVRAYLEMKARESLERAA
jgi:hypothetical protein